MIAQGYVKIQPSNIYPERLILKGFMEIRTYSLCRKFHIEPGRLVCYFIYTKIICCSNIIRLLGIVPCIRILAISLQIRQQDIT